MLPDRFDPMSPSFKVRDVAGKGSDNSVQMCRNITIYYFKNYTLSNRYLRRINQEMTIFYSYFTVGKSRYRLFYPNYTLAALLLYIMFSTALPITDDLVYTIKNNWNVTNSTGFSLYNDTTL
ncbi:unnamed protein product [Schistosoma curassoni]|uniref:PhoLip_ATPase_N domain-containing protein n=1 Tax=Schistosoma curassoni TaxID=6186 RepID=A0A183K0L2_9TREM|nr:unnamed protein product [Schistosoma curassoni]